MLFPIDLTDRTVPGNCCGTEMSLIYFPSQLSEMRGLGGGSGKQQALCVFRGRLSLVE